MNRKVDVHWTVPLDKLSSHRRQTVDKLSSHRRQTVDKLGSHRRQTVDAIVNVFHRLAAGGYKNFTTPPLCP